MRPDGIEFNLLPATSAVMLKMSESYSSESNISSLRLVVR